MNSDYLTPSDEQRSLLGKLMRWCLTNRLIVAMSLLLIIGAGLYVAPFDWKIGDVPRNPVATDAIPDIGENQQIVFTRWAGRSPQDVQDQVTYPLTTSLLGVPGVKTIRSSSMFGFSTIYVIFEDFSWSERFFGGKDFYWTRSRILEKLNSLPDGTLPAGVKPTLGPDSTALGQIFWYTLEGRNESGEPVGGWDLEELRTIQDWNVRYALMSAKGVSEVASVGGFQREYQVDVDPDKMRFHKVTLPEVFKAVAASNIDVGAGTIELNKIEYLIRGVGFIRRIEDIENSVVKTTNNVPVLVKHVAVVSQGPALRRGALDKDGAEAVGGVVVARYGDNPLEVINNTKRKIDEEIAPSLPEKIVIDHEQTDEQTIRHFAAANGFDAYADGQLNHEAWIKFIRANPSDRPAWAQISKVTVVPFYDRTGLIYETLGTLNRALGQEILITIIVVVIMVMHLRSSILIGGMLPLAVLLCFVAMKAFGVEANVVALAGIAIAIGTIVDMGIVLCENILRHLEAAPPEAPRLEVIHRAASEVGSAVLTAVMTTIIGFLPVFALTGSAGKLFGPLAFTKTFALVASILITLTILPAGAYLLFCGRISAKWLRNSLYGLVAAAGVAIGYYGIAQISLIIFTAGVAVTVSGVYGMIQNRLPQICRRLGRHFAGWAVAIIVAMLLTKYWEPLGPELGLVVNFLFVAVLIGSLLIFFRLFLWVYPHLLGWCLDHKAAFLAIPITIVILGLASWLGFAVVFPWVLVAVIAMLAIWTLRRPAVATVLAIGGKNKSTLRWAPALLVIGLAAWIVIGVFTGADAFDRPAPGEKLTGMRTRSFWAAGEKKFPGLGREFRPPLDEGSFLYMPTTMTHASIGEAMGVLSTQDVAFRNIPEVHSAVGKIGRAETPLDPVPISMVETVINYLPEYKTDKDGRRQKYRIDYSDAGMVDAVGKGFATDAGGNLIPDEHGELFRQWREHIKSPDDIWDEIVKAGKIPGSTSAPKLQPISTRLVMLQSGMRSKMGIRVTGPSLVDIERAAIDIEKLLKEVPGIKPETVSADRIVGKPYLHIIPDRDQLQRHGVKMLAFQNILETAAGGKGVTQTVMGRERFAVRVRYQRELRDTVEQLGRILIPATGGQQIPLSQVAQIKYVEGPQAIKSENAFLSGYVLFDKADDVAEVDIVERARDYLQSKLDSGQLILPAGVSYSFEGTYRQQVKSAKTLLLVIPIALFLIVMILYMQFRSLLTTLMVFSGVFVAAAGGFILLWAYGQGWFLDFSIFGVEMRDLFQVHPINMSVAVWVGMLALFGIATDDGVVMSTYLKQSFDKSSPQSVAEIRQQTIEAAMRRVRPCLMTTATTILALLPVLTSTGRGSDVMVPMAIPSFGGMLIEVVTMLVVPVLFCMRKEAAAKRSGE